MNIANELIETLRAEDELTGQLLVNSPTMLRAWVIEREDARYVLEYLSPVVNPHGELYEPVARYLEQNPHSLVYENEFEDAMMMKRKAIIRLYRLD